VTLTQRREEAKAQWKESTGRLLTLGTSLSQSVCVKITRKGQDTIPPAMRKKHGLLTGLEASLLNLQGTELVILSACVSGTGEVKIGEGVMSLRRAFRIAGAQTVLASHWKVSDKATSQLMTEFIRRWRSGEPRAKAWREAQLSLLHSNEFKNPYFWAAFTLTGQWR
jgi:CHAT domain-containing protein